MPNSLGYHGCAITTINNMDYLAIIGGQNSSLILKSIYMLNLATKQWETYTRIILPLPISQIIGNIVLQLDQQGDKAITLSVQFFSIVIYVLL